MKRSGRRVATPEWVGAAPGRDGYKTLHVGETGPAGKQGSGDGGAAGGALARLPRAIGQSFSGFWRGLELRTRQGLAFALAALAALLLFFFVVVPALPCSLPGGDECAPDDEAAELVPGDALAYVHANLDPETEQHAFAAGVAERLPAVTQQLGERLLAQVPGPDGAPPDFEEDVRPWFGGEAAIALIPAGGSAAEQVQLLEVADEKGARKFAESTAAGNAQTEDYQGVEIQRDDRGLASAQVGGFLAIGTASGVRAVIDVDTDAGETRSLAESGDAQDVAELLPEHRVAEAYLSEDGVEELVGGGALASLEAFVNADAAQAAGVALVAGEEDLELAVRSVLDPERTEAQPGFFDAFPSFEPALTSELDPGVLAYVGIGDPSSAVKNLLAQADAEAPDIAAGFDQLNESLRDLGKVNVERDLLPALGGEAAFVLGLREGDEGGGVEPNGGEAVPGLPGEDTQTLGAELDRPYVEMVADDVDEDAARDAMARLQGPIAEAFEPQGEKGQAPTFERVELDGVEAQGVSLSPTVDLTYAVFDSLLAIATDPAGVEELAAGDGGLDESEKFELATDELAEEPALLAYFNLTDLVTLGEREGLAEDSAYATFAAEFGRLEALGLTVEQSDSEFATDVRLLVGEGAEDPQGAGSEPGQGTGESATGE